MKKFMLTFVVVLFIILLSFSNSKADWIDKGQYFEMDSTYGEIKDFKISEDGQIWAVNAQNEILNIDFETGKLINIYKCEVISNLQFRKISKDGTNTIFVHFKMPWAVPTLLEVSLKIYNNTNKKIVLDTIVKIELKGEGETDGINISDVDYSIKNQLLLLNLNYGAGGNFGDGVIGGRDYNNFIIFDTKNKIKLVDLNLTLESHNINLSKGIEEFYFIGNEFSSETNNSGTDYTSTNSKSYFQKYNLKEKKVDKLIGFNYSTYRELNSGNSSNSGNPSFFQELLQPQNDSLLYVIFHNKLNKNEIILYTFDKFTNKYIDSIIIDKNIKNCKLDNKDFLHIINDNTYKIKFISNSLITLDSLLFPENVHNNQLFNNSERSFVLFSDNKSKFYYFTTENLKNVPSNGFIASKTLVSTKEKLRFFSFTSFLGYTYEWEVEPGVVIKTNTNYLEYTYQNIGIYDIKLKIIDKQGNEYYFEKLKYITIKEELIAGFDYSFDKITRNCIFISKSTGLITKYIWDFGDEILSNDTNPVHYYTNDGNYLVKLIITNGIDFDTLDTYIEIKDNSYLLDSKSLLKKYSIVNLIKPEQYFLVNNILKVFSYLNSKIHYDDRWNDYYDISYSYSYYNLNLNSFDLLKSYYIYHYKKYDYFYKFYPSKVLNVNDSNLLFMSNYLNKPYPNLYYQNKYLDVENIWYHDAPLNYKFVIESPLLLEADFKSLNEYHVYHSIDSVLRISKFNTYDSLGSSTIYLTNKINQIKIANMKDSLLVVYSDSTDNYNGKLILENQNIGLFSNISIDSNFVLTHTKLINNNIVLFGYFAKGNSTIAKVFVYNLQSKALKEFNLPIFKNIEDIVIFNQNLLIAGETINMSGYVLFDKDFTNYKFNYNEEYFGQVKKIHLINNIVNLVCEKQNNNKYDVIILQDTLEDVTSVNSNLENKWQALIFPNPSSDKISLDLGGVAVEDLVIYDILGNEVMSLPHYTNKTEIDISTLSIGTYTIQIQTSTGSISKRLLVNR